MGLATKRRFDNAFRTGQRTTWEPSRFLRSEKGTFPFGRGDVVLRPILINFPSVSDRNHATNKHATWFESGVAMVVCCFLVLALLTASPSLAWAAEAHKSLGEQLRSSIIWTAEQPAPKGWLHAGFRRDFELEEIPAQADLQVFAYTRYQLFVNGQYVGRGPNRYENKRPEYDEWNLRSHLRKGHNVVALLVHRDFSPAISSDFSVCCFSRIEYHEPGLAARLDLRQANGRNTVITTDSQWLGFREPAYGDPQGCHYSSIPETIDARRSPGDWISVDFNPQGLRHAVPVDTSDAKVWPVLHPRTIPLLRESAVPFTVDVKGPVVATGDVYTMEAGSELVLHCPRIVQAYAVLGNRGRR